MSAHYDTLETRAPAEREGALFAALPAQLAHARYDMKHGWAPRATAVGAALIALPLGYLVGRLMANRPRAEWQQQTSRTDLGTGL